MGVNSHANQKGLEKVRQEKNNESGFSPASDQPPMS
jgi:hypothetical protein